MGLRFSHFNNCESIYWSMQGGGISLLIKQSIGVSVTLRAQDPKKTPSLCVVIETSLRIQTVGRWVGGTLSHQSYVQSKQIGLFSIEKRLPYSLSVKALVLPSGQPSGLRTHRFLQSLVSQKRVCLFKGYSVRRGTLSLPFGDS